MIADCTCTAHFAADPAEHDTDCPAIEADYCGCCGNEIGTDDGNWCDRCTEHVAHFVPANAWERTYFALNGIGCPFRIGVTSDLPPHPFVDTGRLALRFFDASGGVPVCDWDPDGRGVCDRPRQDSVHISPAVS